MYSTHQLYRTFYSNTVSLQFYEKILFHELILSELLEIQKQLSQRVSVECVKVSLQKAHCPN